MNSVNKDKLVFIICSCRLGWSLNFLVLVIVAPILFLVNLTISSAKQVVFTSSSCSLSEHIRFSRGQFSLKRIAAIVSDCRILSMHSSLFHVFMPVAAAQHGVQVA